MEHTREIRQVKHTFGREEREQLGARLIEEMNALSATQGELKEIKDQYKAKLTEGSLSVESIRGKLTAGYEMRPVECLVELHPREGRKDCFHPATGDLVYSGEMSATDFAHAQSKAQLELVPKPDEKAPQPQEAAPAEAEAFTHLEQELPVWGDDPEVITGPDKPRSTGCVVDLTRFRDGTWSSGFRFLASADRQTTFWDCGTKMYRSREEALLETVFSLTNALKREHGKDAEGFKKPIRAFLEANKGRVE